ncbi:hypothetical protein J7E93_15590 [Streptomyces sp. ISL-36]|uniref:alpha/beta hydrolase domain-containing protein n=1 Tax=Streptomyces sp. ISL-36 TaxID=2819182 RepID=UPI001BEB02AC|nr:alpha/beta hydrolase domain-containing protein [Streptomyces sp. ISL-36]MBT2441512.1 hypothetical protein [Streptomyces sp. ISL-36]
MPYRISAPADPHRSNGTVLVEPPHFVVGLGTLNVYLRQELLFSRGFIHAGIGWSTLGDRILDPQADLAAGRFTGKVVVVNSEADDSTTLLDRGVAPDRYRFYVVAGSPHVPDPLDAPLNLPFPVQRSTPATFVPALRAHFLQAHDWVCDERKGSTPPLSTRLRTLSDGSIARDAVGNAITEDRTGRRRPPLCGLAAPEHPAHRTPGSPAASRVSRSSCPARARRAPRMEVSHPVREAS